MDYKLITRKGESGTYVNGTHTQVNGVGSLFLLGKVNTDTDSVVGLGDLLLDYDITKALLFTIRGASVVMTDKSPAIIMTHVSDPLVEDDVLDVTAIYEMVNNPDVINKITGLSEEEKEKVAGQFNQRVKMINTGEEVELFTASNLQKLLTAISDSREVLKGNAKTGTELAPLIKNVDKEVIDKYNEGKSLSPYRYEVKRTAVQKTPDDRVMIQLPRIRELAKWQRVNYDDQAIGMPNPIDLAHYEHPILSSSVYHMFIQQDKNAQDYYNESARNAERGFSQWDELAIQKFIQHDPELVQGSADNNGKDIYPNEQELYNDMINLIKATIYASLPADQKTPEKVEEKFKLGTIPEVTRQYFKELLSVVVSAGWQHTGLIPLVDLYEGDEDSDKDTEETDTSMYRAELSGDLSNYRTLDVIAVLSSELDKAIYSEGASALPRMIIELLRWGNRKISRLKLSDNSFLDMNQMIVTKDSGVREEDVYIKFDTGEYLRPAAYVVKNLSSNVAELLPEHAPFVSDAVVGMLVFANTTKGNRVLFLSLLDYFRLTEVKSAQLDFCARYGITDTDFDVFIDEERAKSGNLEVMKAEDVIIKIFDKLVEVVSSKDVLEVSLMIKKTVEQLGYLQAYLENGSNVNLADTVETHNLEVREDIQKAIYNRLVITNVINYNLFKESLDIIGKTDIAVLTEDSSYQELKDKSIKRRDCEFMRKSQREVSSNSSNAFSGGSAGNSDEEKNVIDAMVLPGIPKTGGKNKTVRLYDGAVGPEKSVGLVVLCKMPDGQELQVVLLSDTALKLAEENIAKMQYANFDTLKKRLNGHMTLAKTNPEGVKGVSKRVAFGDKISYERFLKM